MAVGDKLNGVGRPVRTNLYPHIGGAVAEEIWAKIRLCASYYPGRFRVLATLDPPFRAGIFLSESGRLRANRKRDVSLPLLQEPLSILVSNQQSSINLIR